MLTDLKKVHKLTKSSQFIEFEKKFNESEQSSSILKNKFTNLKKVHRIWKKFIDIKKYHQFWKKYHF